jgi:hypothetical protein
MTKQEACVVAAYTGVMIGEFSDMHEYIEKIMGRPVFTHELASSKTMEEIRNKARTDFIAIKVK